MRYCYIDLETTGLDPKRCAIVQIGAVLVDGNRQHEIDIKMAPFSGARIEDEALKVNNLSREQIQNFQGAEVAWKEFLGNLNNFRKHHTLKYQFVAYNARFDNEFIYQYFNRFQTYSYYKEYFFHPPIDIMNLVAYHYRDKRDELKYMNLKAVCSKLKIKNEKAHEALSDVKAMMEIEKKLYSTMNQMELF